VHRLVEVHRTGRVDGEERQLGDVVGPQRERGGRGLRVRLDGGWEAVRQPELGPDLRETRA
jgi:hypothetical protein